MFNRFWNLFRRYVQKTIVARLPIDNGTYYSLRFFLFNKRFLNINQPSTFFEKLNWYRLHYDFRNYGQFADKLAVREFIREKVGEDKLIKLLAVYRTVEEINFSQLPEQFYLTANHGSNMNYFCFDRSKLDVEEVKFQCRYWLKTDYSKKARETNYENIQPSVLALELLIDSEGNIPIDYKFFCFNGKAKCIQVDLDRFTDHRRDFYSPEWELLPIHLSYPSSGKQIRKPTQLSEMISIAETLASNFPFVRVDLYNLNGKVYFGELTFTPNGGFPKISYQDDQLIGSWFDLSAL